MKKNVGMVSLLIPLALLVGCSSSPSLGERIEKGVDAGDESFALAEVAPADATSFLVVCPYDSKQSVNDRLGFTWTDAPDLSQNDDRQVIALIEDRTVVSSAELSRDIVDFCSSDSWEVLPLDTELSVSTEGRTSVVSAP